MSAKKLRAAKALAWKEVTESEDMLWLSIKVLTTDPDLRNLIGVLLKRFALASGGFGRATLLEQQARDEEAKL